MQTLVKYLLPQQKHKKKYGADFEYNAVWQVAVEHGYDEEWTTADLYDGGYDDEREATELALLRATNAQNWFDDLIESDMVLCWVDDVGVTLVKGTQY